MDTNSATSGDTRTMKASEFKARRLQPKTLFGIDRGRMKITGDIISPIDVEWEAESNPDRVLNP